MGKARTHGTGCATAVALAAGPDGLRLSDLSKDQGPVTPADAGAGILKRDEYREEIEP